MGFMQPELEKESPLDALTTSSSRLSLASTSSAGSGILEAFPLPLEDEASDPYAAGFGNNMHDGDHKPEQIIEPRIQFEHKNCNNKKINKDYIRLDSSHTPNISFGNAINVAACNKGDDDGKKKSSMHNITLVSNRRYPTDEKQSPHLQRTQKRYLRYGRSYEYESNVNGNSVHRDHVHSASFNGYGSGPAPISPNLSAGFTMPDSQASNMSLPRPYLTRTHSSSRSWDAGGSAAGTPSHYIFPQPHPNVLGGNDPKLIPRLNSWEEHVTLGCHALRIGRADDAYRHWVAAASEPWKSTTALLLLELGALEKWFPNTYHIPYKFPSESLRIRSINTIKFKEITAEIYIQVRNSLDSLGSVLKCTHDTVNAVAAFELSGAMGSKEALLSAAQIYYKGSKGLKKDTARAQKLYNRANAL